MKMQYEKEKKINKLMEQKKEKQSETRKQQQRSSCPISWNASESILHMHGTNTLDTKERTTGLYDRENEKSENTKMKEVFRAENSYGNIAMGTNKKKEAMLVVSQKREQNGETTQEHEKNVHMERKKRIKAHFGEHFVNNSQKEESAWAYKGNTKKTEKKMWGEMKEFHKKSDSNMMEKRMPFLALEKEKKELVSLREQIREKYENGEKKEGEFLEKQKQILQQEIFRKEQNEKVIQKKLQLAWEKARKINADDFELKRTTGEREEIEEMEGLSEIPNLESGNGEKSKK